MEKRNVSISLPSTGDDEWAAVRECLQTGWLTQGPKVTQFEKSFAEKHRVKHALAVTSCTTGLHLALLALGIGPGDEVLVPAFTWVATANVVLYCGATPVLVDIDPISFNIDPKKIKEKITKKTKAIIPVHLFGLAADMDAIRKEIPPHVKIIEDAACAAGASYKGKMAGSLGDLAVFSFHPRKSITTGEGGMITTERDDLAEIIGQLRSHGASLSEEMRHHGPQPYLLPNFDVLGFNYRMTDIQGSVGYVQLQKLERFIQERKEKASYYKEALKEIDWLLTPEEPVHYGHAWQSYVCRIDPTKAPFSRNKIMEDLYVNGISCRPGTHAVHTLGLYKKLYKFEDADFPCARDGQEYSISIPLHNKMCQQDFEYVVYHLKNIHHGYKV